MRRGEGREKRGGRGRSEREKCYEVCRMLCWYRSINVYSMCVSTVAIMHVTVQCVCACVYVDL